MRRAWGVFRFLGFGPIDAAILSWTFRKEPADEIYSCWLEAAAKRPSLTGRMWRKG